MCFNQAAWQKRITLQCCTDCFVGSFQLMYRATHEVGVLKKHIKKNKHIQVIDCTDSWAMGEMTQSFFFTAYQHGEQLHTPSNAGHCQCCWSGAHNPFWGLEKLDQLCPVMWGGIFSCSSCANLPVLVSSEEGAPAWLTIALALCWCAFLAPERPFNRAVSQHLMSDQSLTQCKLTFGPNVLIAPLLLSDGPWSVLISFGGYSNGEVPKNRIHRLIELRAR